MEHSDHMGSIEKLETIDIGVSGMTCDHCARRVEKALRANPGVKAARVDLAAARATVTYDSSTATVGQLREALTKSGYPPAVSRSP